MSFKIEKFSDIALLNSAIVQMNKDLKNGEIWQGRNLDYETLTEQARKIDEFFKENWDLLINTTINADLREQLFDNLDELARRLNELNSKEHPFAEVLQKISKVIITFAPHKSIFSRRGFPSDISVKTLSELPADELNFAQSLFTLKSLEATHPDVYMKAMGEWINKNHIPLNKVASNLQIHFHSLHFADLSGLQFTEEEFLEFSKNHPSLKTLKLHNASVTQIPDFNMLERLEVIGCPIVELPNICSHLTSLILSGCKIANIPISYTALTKLTINLCSNIKSLPDELINLDTLDISDTLISKLPETYRNLTKLNISGGLISDLPKGLDNLTELICKFVELSEGSYAKLPANCKITG